MAHGCLYYNPRFIRHQHFLRRPGGAPPGPRGGTVGPCPDPPSPLVVPGDPRELPTSRGALGRSRHFPVLSLSLWAVSGLFCLVSRTQVSFSLIRGSTWELPRNWITHRTSLTPGPGARERAAAPSKYVVFSCKVALMRRRSPHDVGFAIACATEIVHSRAVIKHGLAGATAGHSRRETLSRC